MTRHSRNNNDLSYFTSEERKKLRYGTQRERLGKDSIKPFDACCICLKAFTDPLSCQSGHVFCKECIFESLLSQKKEIKRKVALYNIKQERKREQEQTKQDLEKQAEIEAFQRENFHVAQPAESKEENHNKLRAFWVPSATPEAEEKAEAPVTETCCPEGKEKLKLKGLFSIILTEVPNTSRDDSQQDAGVEYMCPSCSTTLSNRTSIATLNTCGHVFCKTCAEKFIVPAKACSACNRACKSKNIVNLENGGTGFASHDEKLVAKAFKHVGSGTGMGISRPGPTL